MATSAQPFWERDGLTVEDAGKLLRDSGAVEDRSRSSPARYIYYVAATQTWIAYEASKAYRGQFKLSYYKECPCG